MKKIPAGKKYITVEELKEAGLSYYQMEQMVMERTLEKASKSVYENIDYLGEDNEFYSAEAYVPDGVICLLSAARYYQLTDYLPDAVEVAVSSKKKVTTLPVWPAIKLHYYSPVRLSTGVVKITEGYNSFHIFDLEKTVVDIACFRNRVGIEETSEILKNYLKRDDRDMEKLHTYAKKLRCDKVMRTYLEVLL